MDRLKARYHIHVLFINSSLLHIIITYFNAQLRRNMKRWYPSLGKLGEEKGNSSGYKLL